MPLLACSVSDVPKKERRTSTTPEAFARRDQTGIIGQGTQDSTRVRVWGDTKMKNLKLIGAVFLLCGIALVSACSDGDGDGDEDENGGTGGESTGGQATGGNGNGTGSNDSGTGGAGTGGSATGGMGGMSEGGMGGMGGNSENPIDVTKVCVGTCSLDANCPTGLCDEGIDLCRLCRGLPL